MKKSQNVAVKGFKAASLELSVSDDEESQVIKVEFAEYKAPKSVEDRSNNWNSRCHIHHPHHAVLHQ